MPKRAWLYDILLTLHDNGALHRDAIVARVGKQVKPEVAVRAHGQLRHGDGQHTAAPAEMDMAVRDGKHIIVVRSITAAVRAGYVKKGRDGKLLMSKSGLDKLIKVKPHRLSLPLSADPVLVKIFDQIKHRIRDSANPYVASHNKGLLASLSVIHRVTRGL